MAGMATTGSEARPMPARGRAWAIYDVFETKDSEKLLLALRQINNGNDCRRI